MNRSTNRRRRTLALDALESRVAPVGFLEGQAWVPVHLELRGTARGSEGTSAHDGVTTIRIAAEGTLHFVGAARVYARLQVAGSAESGAIVVQSKSSDTTLAVHGTAGEPLAFTVTSGTTAVPNTTFYASETGSGTVSIAPYVSRGRTMIALTFAS